MELVELHILYIMYNKRTRNSVGELDPARTGPHSALPSLLLCMYVNAVQIIYIYIKST